jgi:hypothetical protein
MADVGGLVAPITFGYGAALAGAAAALLVRAWARRCGRVPSLLEAGWCASLPLAAVLLLPLAASLQPHALPIFDAWHELWHRWEAAIHRSATAHGALHWANSGVLATSIYLLGRTLFAFTRMWSFEGVLRGSARSAEQEGVYFLATARPLCFTVGLLRPAVYVTTGLREQLSARDLQAVLAHEAAHVRRRDTLTAAVLTLFYTLLPVPGTRLLLREWRRAAERACDREAAREVGNPCDVAAALVRVARLAAQAPTRLPNGACFAEWGEDIEGRVQALLRGPEHGRRSGWVTGLLTTLSMGLVLSAALWLPHAVELFAHH